LTAGQLFFLNKDDREEHLNFTAHANVTKIISYIITHASLITFIFIYKADFNNAPSISLSTMLILNTALYLFKFDRNSESLRYIMRIGELSLLTACAYFIATNKAPLVAILSFALMVARANKDIRKEADPLVQVITGIKLTVLVLCTVKGLTTWLDTGDVFSIITMLTALACILAGFGFMAKSLRDYGDVIFMLASGYGVIYIVCNVTPLPYMLMIFVLTAGQLFFLNKDDREEDLNFTARVNVTKIISYIITHASLITFIFIYKADFNNTQSIFLSIILILNIVLYIFKFGGSSDFLRYNMRIGELSLLTACAYFIATNKAPFVVLLSFALMVVRANRDIRKEASPLVQVLTGIKFTVLVLCALKGFTTWLDDGYVFSIITMVTAFACVLAGFRFMAKSLRIYGLVITILCVLKLTIVDVSGLSTPMRVFTMIAGGLICFAINAAYNYAVKNLINQE
jgi:uncharacterized membrane protein